MSVQVAAVPEGEGEHAATVVASGLLDASGTWSSRLLLPDGSAGKSFWLRALSMSAAQRPVVSPMETLVVGPGHGER